MLPQYQSICTDQVSVDVYSRYQYQDRKSSASSTASTSSSGSNQSTCQNVVSCQMLANALQRNWNDNFADQGYHDESLTNLSWLHNVNPLKINAQLSFAPFTGYPRDHQDHTTRAQPVLQSTAVHINQSMSLGQPDYKNNPNLKPPFSYAILISWAMKDLMRPKITLSDIYSWIVDNFAYYRHADSSWQNSIRHNLSLGKCFEKVPRRKDEPGKGGFWRINPMHSRALDASLSKVKYHPGLHRSQQTARSNYNSVSTPFDGTETCSQTNSAPIKRSRKSPLMVTQEEWPDSQDAYFPGISQTHDNDFRNSTHSFDLSPFDDSSTSDSVTTNNHCYGTTSDRDLSLNTFNNPSLDCILTDSSPTTTMMIDKDDFIDQDEFQLLNSTSDFTDMFFTSTKDDLRELDSLLGIF